MDFLIDPGFWLALFSVTLVQIALGADNLIIITIIANKLPGNERDKAVRWGLILAMLFRIVLLSLVSYILTYATSVFSSVDTYVFDIHLEAEWNVKSLVLIVGGLVLIWKGIKELRVKAKGVGEEAMGKAGKFSEVVTVIVAMNLLVSVDSILTVVGMTDRFPVMVGSVVISVALMLAFAKRIADYLSANPDFEILGLFVMLLIGFVLFLEGGHVAHLKVGDDAFPYVPQWIVIFVLILMFCVDLYQNWYDGKREQHPVELHHRKK